MPRDESGFDFSALDVVASTPDAGQGFDFSAIELPQAQESEGPSLSQSVLRTGLRVGGGVLGSIAGGVVGAPAGPAGMLAGAMAGGGIGSGLGELGAEWLESQPGRGQVRESINPTQIATQTAIGAIPISRAKAGLSLLQAGIRQAGKGAALAGGANVATNLAEDQDPSLSGVAGSAALGAVLGGGIGAVAHRPTGPFLRTPSAPRGYLRAAPSFIAGEAGPAARYGETIPMAQAPDGSFVRSVPAEYARREVAGLLPAARGFSVDDAGRAVPTERLPDLTRVAAGPRPVSNADPSKVASQPAAIAARDFEGRTVTRTQYSSDLGATDSPLIDLSPEDAQGLRWVREELESLPFVQRGFREAGAGRGGDLEVIPGAAGAPIYDDIQQVRGSRATRGEVVQGINRLLNGEQSAVGQDALIIARRLMAGDSQLRRRMQLPPEAGDLRPAVAESGARIPTRGLSEGEERGIAELDAVMEAIHGPDWAPKGNGTFQPARAGSALDDFDEFNKVLDEPVAGSPEAGEFGGINPMLLARTGGGAAGAIYGAATGEDPGERAERAALFGLAGVAAPSVIRRGGGFLRTGTPAAPGRGSITQAAEARGPIPRAGEIPANRQRTMPVLTAEVQDAADAILERHGGFQRQRRGVQSVERTEGLADRVEVRTDRPLAAGTALNAERLRAYQNATATILRKQQQLEDVVRGGRATPADELELARVKTEAEVLTASFRGAAAEAGRALHVLRYQARILQSGDTEAIREAVQVSRRGLSEQAQSVFYANILSGPQTHERNVLGNLSNAIYNLAAHPLAVGADVVRSAATGQARQVFLGELPERVAGTVVALPRAFSNALRALRTGVPAADVTTFDRPAIREFAGGGKNPFNYPKRLLESVDDFFSTVAAEQTLYGSAFAQAKREGLSGDDFLRRVAELKVNPSDDILHEVEQQRARLLFREKPGNIADALLAAKRHVPQLGYVVPFVRVPANIIRQGFEASPAGFAMKSARQGGRAGADAMGRAAMGSLVLAPLAYYAALGKITGNAPNDPAQRAAFYESGKRPHSIQFGDTWYSYQPIQPLNVPLSLVANAFQVWSETKDDSDATADAIALSLLGRMGRSLLDQSFLSGVSALVAALDDPERHFVRFAQQVATGFVPMSGFLRTTAQATDPYIRNPHGIGEGLQAIIPGASQKLDPRLTRFGEPVQRVEGAVNVFKPSPVVNDPVAAALEQADVNIRPAQGPKAVTVRRGVKIPLERDEQFAAGQASGRVVRQAIERLIATTEFQRANPVGQQFLMERTIAQARGAVNQQLLREAILQRLEAR